MRKELETREKELESIRNAIEHHEGRRENLISEVARLHKMAESGEISFYEFDALERRRSEAGKAVQLCMNMVHSLRLAEQDALTAMEWARYAYAGDSGDEKEHKAPYILFTALLFAVSAAMFAVLHGGVTGHAAAEQALTGPDYMLFTISAGIVTAVFFLLVKFAFNSENI